MKFSVRKRVNLIEILRRFFHGKETQPAPLTEADINKIWGLTVEPIVAIEITSKSQNFGEIPPGTPGYAKEVVTQKDYLAGEYPECSILERRAIDPVTRKENPTGKIVLVVVPKV